MIARTLQAPSPGSDGARAADQVPGLAPADPARAVGAFDRLAIDGAVLNRVAWPPAMTAERRIILRVLQEMPDRRRLIRGRLHRPQRVTSPAANVNHAALIQDRVRHTTPVCFVGDHGPVPDAGWAAHSTQSRPGGSNVAAIHEGHAATRCPGPCPCIRWKLAVTARTVQGMARGRSGQAPAWPLASDRSVRRGLRDQA